MFVAAGTPVVSRTRIAHKIGLLLLVPTLGAVVSFAVFFWYLQLTASVSNAKVLMTELDFLAGSLGETSMQRMLEEPQQNLASLVEDFELVLQQLRDSKYFRKSDSLTLLQTTATIQPLEQAWQQYRDVQTRSSDEILDSASRHLVQMTGIAMADLQAYEKTLRYHTENLLLAVALINLFAFAIGIYLVQRVLVKPVRQAITAVEHFQRGDYAYRLPITTRDELSDLARGVNEMASNLEQSIKVMEYTLNESDEKMDSLAAANANMALVTCAAEVLREADKKLHRQGSLRDFYPILLEELMEITSARYGALGLFDDDGKMLDFITAGMSEQQISKIANHPAGKGLLSAFYYQKTPLRIDNIAQDERSAGMPHGHPVMTTLMGTPLVIDDKVKGVLYVSDKRNGEPFTETDESVLKMFSLDVAHILERHELTETILEKNALLDSEHKQLVAANQELKETHAQLLQSEKLASIGQLAAGVAHEINNPIGFIKSNLDSLQHNIQDLLAVIDAYTEAEKTFADDQDGFQIVHQLKQRLDMAFIGQDTRDIIKESLDGARRVSTIVQDLRNFSRVDSDEWEFANLEVCLDSTLNLASNELKHRVEIVKEYSGIPEIKCNASRLNQVFLNMLINASHAIEERGMITLRTGSETGWVWIEIEDNGSGIEEDKLQHIFDPFYTSKPVGQGTGLGLSLSYGIVHKHGGRIEVDSQLGEGTRFRIWLPDNADKPEE